MFTNRRSIRQSGFAAIIALAGLAAPAAFASDAPRAYHDNVTPMSTSQQAMLRHGEQAAESGDRAEPSRNSVPASRSQIEVLDAERTTHPRVASHSP